MWMSVWGIQVFRSTYLPMVHFYIQHDMCFKCVPQMQQLLYIFEQRIWNRIPWPWFANKIVYLMKTRHFSVEYFLDECLGGFSGSVRVGWSQASQLVCVWVGSGEDAKTTKRCFCFTMIFFLLFIASIIY